MDIRQIISDASFSGIRSFAGLITGIILVPVITKLLGADSYGIWKTVLALVSLVTLVGGMHIHGSLVRYVQKRNQSQTFIDILTISILIGAGLTGLISIGAAMIFSIWKISIIPIALLFPAAALIGTRIPGKVLTNHLRAQKRIKSYEVLQIIRSLVEAGSLVVVFLSTGSLIIGLWILVLIMLFFDIVLLFIFLPNHLTWPNPSNFPIYMKYGIPMIPKEIAGNLIDHADKFIIILFLGPFKAGFYIIAYQVAAFIQNTSTIFNSTLYPRVASAWDHGEIDELEKFYQKFLRWYIVLIIPAVVGLSIVSEALIQLISTAEIAQEASPVLPILALAFAFQGLESPLTYILTAAERTRVIGIITVIAVLLNLILNILFVPIAGILAAAIATLIAFAVRTHLLYHFSTTHISIPFPTIYIVKSILATIVMASVLFILPVGSSLYKLIVHPVLGVILFMFSLYMLGGVTKSEKKLLYKWLNSNQLR